MAIEVLNKTDIRCDENSLVSVMQFAFDHLGLASGCELAITIIDITEMAALNQQWMGESGPTDVLSFPMDEITLDSNNSHDFTVIRTQLDAQGPVTLGDIVLSPEYAKAGAERAGTTLDEELQLLTVHGLLHLLGLDHREKDEERAMFALQGLILREWRSRP